VCSSDLKPRRTATTLRSDVGGIMASQHSPADDIVYDLVSVQYHALKAAESTDRYLKDAEDRPDVRAFFEQVAQQDAERAARCHELLGSLAGKGLG